MDASNGISFLTDTETRDAIRQVNERGYAALTLPEDLITKLGEPLYKSVDQVTLHPNREKYYNEIAFYWPEDWRDVDRGIGAFHNENSLRHIYSNSDAERILNEKIGPDQTALVMSFSFQIKQLVVTNHHGLVNNEIRLARVMIRQMNENQRTAHGGADVHEDIGYNDRPYRQLLSVILTTHGLPTQSATYNARPGELLMFNAYDRRQLLGMGEDLAFLHKGPKSGPKMFFFFEFLGPRA